MLCTRKIDSTIALHNIIAEQYSNDEQLQQNKVLELLRVEECLTNIDIVENKPALLGSSINIFSILFAVTSFSVSMGVAILTLSMQLNIATFESYLQATSNKKDLVRILGEGTTESNSSFSLLLNNMHIWFTIFLVLLALTFSFLIWMDSISVAKRSAQRKFYLLYKNIITTPNNKTIL